MADTTTGTGAPKYTDADYEGVQRVNRELQEGKRLSKWMEDAGWTVVDGKATPPQAAQPAPGAQPQTQTQTTKRVRRSDFINPDTNEIDEDAYEAAREKKMQDDKRKRPPPMPGGGGRRPMVHLNGPGA